MSQNTKKPYDLPDWPAEAEQTQEAPRPRRKRRAPAEPEDLWGKLRNAKEAAMYQVLGTEAAQRGMRLSIAAQTSNAYFLLRSLDLQLSTAERTGKTRTDAVSYTHLRAHET